MEGEQQEKIGSEIQINTENETKTVNDSNKTIINVITKVIENNKSEQSSAQSTDDNSQKSDLSNIQIPSQFTSSIASAIPFLPSETINSRIDSSYQSSESNPEAAENLKLNAQESQQEIDTKAESEKSQINIDDIKLQLETIIPSIVSIEQESKKQSIFQEKMLLLVGKIGRIMGVEEESKKLDLQEAQAEAIAAIPGSTGVAMGAAKPPEEEGMSWLTKLLIGGGVAGLIAFLLPQAVRDKIVSVVGDFAKKILGKFGFSEDQINNIFGTIEKSWNLIKDTTMSIWNMIKDVTTTTWNFAKESANFITTMIPRAAGAVSDAYREGYAGAQGTMLEDYPAVAGSLTVLADAIETGVSKWWRKTAFGIPFSGYKSPESDALALSDKAGEAARKAKEANEKEKQLQNEIMQLRGLMEAEKLKNADTVTGVASATISNMMQTKLVGDIPFFGPIPNLIGKYGIGNDYAYGSDYSALEEKLNKKIKELEKFKQDKENELKDYAGKNHMDPYNFTGLTPGTIGPDITEDKNTNKTETEIENDKLKNQTNFESIKSINSKLEQAQQRMQAGEANDEDLEFIKKEESNTTLMVTDILTTFDERLKRQQQSLFEYTKMWFEENILNKMNIPNTIKNPAIQQNNIDNSTTNFVSSIENYRPIAPEITRRRFA